jgi:hypothetical protein
MNSTDNMVALKNALNAAWPVVITRDGHERVAPGSKAVAVKVGAKVGNLISVTDDGWVEIQLAGETRRDEYPIEQVELASQAEVEAAYA